MSFYSNHRLCVLCVWLFYDRYFHLFYIDYGFLFAFWAVKRKVLHFRIFTNFEACFILADGT